MCPREETLMLKQIARILLLGTVAAGVETLSAQQPPPRSERARGHVATHAVAGTLKHVDLTAGTLTIATVENVVEALQFDAKTMVHGFARVEKVKALVGKEGASLVIHYTGEGVEARALTVEYVGTEPLKLATGTVVRIDRPSRKVVLKLEAGGEDTFELARSAPIDLPTGIVPLAAFAPKPDEKIMAVYTEKGNEKTIRLIRQVAPSTVSVR
jgi:hypothetical protein